MYGMILAELLR